VLVVVVLWVLAVGVVVAGRTHTLQHSIPSCLRPCCICHTRRRLHISSQIHSLDLPPKRPPQLATYRRISSLVLWVLVVLVLVVLL